MYADNLLHILKNSLVISAVSNNKVISSESWQSAYITQNYEVAERSCKMLSELQKYIRCN